MRTKVLRQIIFFISIAFLTTTIAFSAINCFAEEALTRLSDYKVIGKGSAIEPYIIKIDGQNNFLREADAEQMMESSPEAIWLVEHKKADGTIDYTLRFSSNTAHSVTPPFSLDVKAWQDTEGTLQVQIGENDSDYLPITLTLDISNFKGFEEGNIVTVTGGMNMRLPIQEGKIEMSLEQGGDCYLTADGYEPPVVAEENKEDIKEIGEKQNVENKGYWDKPNEKGETVMDNYVHAGSSQLPFKFDFSKTEETFVDGKSFNEMRDKGQSRLFLYKDNNNKILWSYLVESRRLTKVPNNKKYDFSTKVSNDTINIAQKGEFPCEMRAYIYVGDSFKNAEILSIKGKNIETASVVDRGYISFYLKKGGTYQISSTGETVSSKTVNDAKLVSESSRDNMYTTQNYKGERPYGSRDEPLTILGKLDDFFWASWRSINTVAGYSSDMNATEASYDPSKIMDVSIEYRSPTTGKLIASISINGAEWRMTPENMKGPYYLDYKLNPSREIVQKTLKSHSLYIGKYAKRREQAIETLTALSENPNTTLFLMSRTREFAGAINYKIDMSNYYKPGDILHFKYLLGSCNGDLYHGKAANNAELLTEESTYSRYDANYIVDSQGYISFPLYTGGFFVFTKTGETQEVSDVWSPSLNSGKSQGENIASTTKIKEEKIYMDEKVNDKKETEIGVLTDLRAKEQLETPNYKKALKNIIVEGYLNNPNVEFKYAEEFKSEEQKACYEIRLLKDSGFFYKMEQGEYLNVNCNLGKGYSIYDENLLYVKELKDNQFTSEVFAVSSKLHDDGDMYLDFKTTHTGKFGVFCADSEEQLAAAVSLKQEYTSEGTTLLAEQSLKKKNSTKTIKLLLISTLLLIGGGLFISEIKRRKKQ